MYNQEEVNLILSEDPVCIPFPCHLPAHEVSYAANTMQVKSAGTYVMCYGLTATPYLSANLQAQILANGQPLPATAQTMYTGIGRGVALHNFSLVDLPALAEISLQLSADKKVDVDLSQAQLAMMRIG